MAMTDLEMTKLCAEAMGWTFVDAGPIENIGWRAPHYEEFGKIIAWEHSWIPLHNDAHAMALVKKFELFVHYQDGWNCYGDGGVTANSPLLNNAIVECVAKMQASK